MMELLLNYLEDRNKPLVDKPDRTGQNPLIHVAKSGNMPLLKLLIREKDLNIDFEDIVRLLN
jgi:hypothetical protein